MRRRRAAAALFSPLDYNWITAAGLEFLADAGAKGFFAQLETLQLDANPIMEAGAIVLGKLCGTVPQLSTLSLKNCSISKGGTAALAKAAADGAMKQLKRIYLGPNQIGDDGVIDLAKAWGDGAMKKLKFLWLSQNNIGSGGAKALADAVAKGALPHLEKVNITKSAMLASRTSQTPLRRARCRSLRSSTWDTTTSVRQGSERPRLPSATAHF